jgi:hypothetical protein
MTWSGTVEMINDMNDQWHEWLMTWSGTADKKSESLIQLFVKPTLWSHLQQICTADKLVEFDLKN